MTQQQSASSVVTTTQPTEWRYTNSLTGVALALTVVCSCTPNGSSKYQAFLESLAGELEGAAAGNSFIYLNDFNVHMGNNSVNGRVVTGRINLSDPNPSGDLC